MGRAAAMRAGSDAFPCYGPGRLHSPIPGLSGHSVFLLLVQLALLVAAAG
jgi:hypothetical protein